jgi:uncharacterized protein YbaR (Trm112 family)
MDSDTNILEDACCPRCRGDVKKMRVLSDSDYNTYGYRVRHDGERCGFLEWAIFDPSYLDGEVGLPGEPAAKGVSVCRTCYRSVQHFHVPEPGDVELLDPPRDEDGEIVCHFCDESEW